MCLSARTVHVTPFYCKKHKEDDAHQKDEFPSIANTICLCPLKCSRWLWNFNVLNWSVKLNIFFIIYHYLWKGSKLRGFCHNQRLTDRPFEEITCTPPPPLPPKKMACDNFCDNIIVIPWRILHWVCLSVQLGESLCYNRPNLKVGNTNSTQGI